MEESKDKEPPSGSAVWLAIGVILTFPFLTMFISEAYDFSGVDNARSWSESSLGERGDFLTGFFAPIAFIWAFIAVMYQREELRLQWKEMRKQSEIHQQTMEAIQQRLRFETRTYNIDRIRETVSMVNDLMKRVIGRFQIEKMDKKDILTGLNVYKSTDFLRIYRRSEVTLRKGQTHVTVRRELMRILKLLNELYAEVHEDEEMINVQIAYRESKLDMLRHQVIETVNHKFH